MLLSVVQFHNLQPPSLANFHEYLCSLSLSSSWVIRLCDGLIELQLVELCRQKQLECDPIVVARSLIVNKDFTWVVHVHGHKLGPLKCSVTSAIPLKLGLDDFKKLADVVTGSSICIGNPDERFIKMSESRKGEFLSPSKEVVSFLDSGRCITVGSVTHTSTIRHCHCELLVASTSSRCKTCSRYRSNLRAMYSNYCKAKSDSAIGANLRYMQTPQKDRRIRALKNALRNKQRKIQRLKAKLQAITRENGVQVDSGLWNGLRSIVECNQDSINRLATDDFKRVFWQQQV